MRTFDRKTSFNVMFKGIDLCVLVKLNFDWQSAQNFGLEDNFSTSTFFPASSHPSFFFRSFAVKKYQSGQGMRTPSGIFGEKIIRVFILGSYLYTDTCGDDSDEDQLSIDLNAIRGYGRCHSPSTTPDDDTFCTSLEERSKEKYHSKVTSLYV